MSQKLKISSVAAASLAFVITIAAADGSGAAAQNRTPQMTPQALAAVSPAPDNLLPQAAAVPAPGAEQLPSAVDATDGEAQAAPFSPHVASLSRAVTGDGAEAITANSGVSRELECLAGAIYFEAKSESLEGQLAVGRVVINRARSGRFPASYCGVVFQRSQFSFIRGNAMPPINRASRDWQEAVAIAKIANANAYPSPAEGALFFHATRVSPNWRLTKVARVDNHVFYR